MISTQCSGAKKPALGKLSLLHDGGVSAEPRDFRLLSAAASPQHNGPGQPALICLSYTWNDDALKWLPLSAKERAGVMLRTLGEIYPNVDIESHVVGDPLTISWEDEPGFAGAFKINLPGHYRYQRRLYTQFMHEDDPTSDGIYLAGGDVSWTAGWAEGAVTTGLNAVWGVLNQLGGRSAPENPGPGDRFHELAPVVLPQAGTVPV